jgi:uncharacterized membrane protein YkoI
MLGLAPLVPLLLSLLLAVASTQAIAASPNGSSDRVTEENPATQQSPIETTAPTLREGDSIWLEKKLAPSTRWIERLIQPLNRWMEHKVQAVKPAANKALAAAIEPLRKTSDGEILSRQEVGAIAQRHTPGKVLAVKLLAPEQAQPRYRIKLLSPQGVIHLLYFDAKSGGLVDKHPSGER